MKKTERDSAVCPPIRLDRIVESLGGHLRGRGDIAIQRVASLQSAASGDISFLSDLRYRPLLEKTRASAVILPDTPTVETRASAIICENPYLYFAEVANLLHPIAKAVPGIHPSAIVDGDASVSTSAQVDAGAYIGRGAHIAAGVVIGPGCSIGAGVSIDVDTHVHPRVTVYADCQIGKRGIVHSGAVIGADGFGMALKGGQWLKIPQTGRVIIGDDVEIGANTTIDRGALDDTVIGDGVKLDNLIQVGHNVRIGAHTAIAGCVGIAGSAHIGKHCTIGGGAIILGHLELADGVHVSATTLITKSVKKPGTYTGAFPFDIHANWGRSAAAIRNLGELVGRVRKVESLLRSENTPSSGKDRRSLEAHLSRGRSRKTEVAKGSAIDGHH